MLNAEGSCKFVETAMEAVIICNVYDKKKHASWGSPSFSAMNQSPYAALN